MSKPPKVITDDTPIFTQEEWQHYRFLDQGRGAVHETVRTQEQEDKDLIAGCVAAIIILGMGIMIGFLLGVIFL